MIRWSFIFFSLLAGCTAQTASQAVPQEQLTVRVSYEDDRRASANEAAFKNEVTAAELRILAAAGQSTVREVDSRWQRDIGGVSGQERVQAALKLIELQDAKLAELQEKTAKLGVNITLEVRQLVQSDI